MANDTEEDLDGTLTAADVAADLQVSPRRAAELLRMGVVPGFRVGRSWRIGRVEYRAWKAEQSRRAAARALRGSRWGY